jgi:hypothetical protein
MIKVFVHYSLGDIPSCPTWLVSSLARSCPCTVLRLAGQQLIQGGHEGNWSSNSEQCSDPHHFHHFLPRHGSFPLNHSGLVDDSDRHALVMKYYKRGSVASTFGGMVYGTINPVNRVRLALQVDSCKRCIELELLYALKLALQYTTRERSGMCLPIGQLASAMHSKESQRQDTTWFGTSLNSHYFRSKLTTLGLNSHYFNSLTLCKVIEFAKGSCFQSAAVPNPQLHPKAASDLPNHHAVNQEHPASPGRASACQTTSLS